MPHVRFLWRRVTPGELGLELTTALAVSAVGIFVYVLYLVELGGSLSPNAARQGETLDLWTDSSTRC